MKFVRPSVKIGMSGVVIDKAMFKRSLKLPPVIGTRKRAMYQEAAEKVFAKRHGKAIQFRKANGVHA